MSNNFFESLNTNSKDEEERIVQDAPIMRSVPLMSSAGPSMLMPSPMSLKSSSRVTAKTAPVSSGNADYSWRVGKLEQLPFMYMVERSHVHVDEEPEEISRRIVDCMRTENIAASFLPNEVC
jgi:hypothetical protein